jgi:AsmA protein
LSAGVEPNRSCAGFLVPRSAWPLSRRARRVLVVLAIAVVAVVAGFTVLLWANTPVIAAQLKERVLPKLSAQLGRPVEVQTVRVQLFPPRGEFENVRIGGPPGEPPLAEVKRARASLRLLPLILSRGHDVELRSLQLEGPRINLVRELDGRWSLPNGAGTGSSPSEFSISRLRIHDGALHIIDRASAPPGDSVALERIEAAARNIGGGGAMHLDLSAALASDRPNLKASLSTNPKGMPRQWSGSITVDPLQVERLRGFLPAGLDHAFTGGRIALQADLATLRDGTLEAKGHLDAHDLSLRGRPAAARSDFVARSRPQAPMAPTVELSGIRLTGPGVDLSGTASMSGQPRQFRFSLAGPLFDLDALLAALPSSSGTSVPSPPLPESMRRQLAGIAASGNIAVDRLIAGRLNAQQVVADARLERGVLTIIQGTARLYGGTLDASSSHAELTRPVPVWDLRARLANVDFGRAMREVRGASPLQGRLNGRFDLRGAGVDWARLRNNMTGTGAFNIQGGAWTSADLQQALAAPLRDALKALGGGASAAQGGSGAPQPTPLRGLEGSFTVGGGALHFNRPLKVQSSFGNASLTGTVGLDQRLDLAGTVQLQLDFVSQVTGLHPGKPVTTPISVRGTLSSPDVHVSEGDIAKGVLEASPPGKLIRKGLHGLFGGG